MPLPAVTTRSLPLAGLEQMLSSCLGLPLGGREQVMRLCAGEEFVERLQTSPCELRSAGGGGTTVWEGGDTCLYINTANSRPNAGKYRNYFWRETAGELSGAVCMCWFPGRGQSSPTRRCAASSPATPPACSSRVSSGGPTASSAALPRSPWLRRRSSRRERRSRLVRALRERRRRSVTGMADCGRCRPAHHLPAVGRRGALLLSQPHRGLGLTCRRRGGRVR